MIEKAVILARGLGKRMRAAAKAELTPQQAAAAEQGFKGLVPIGRPFVEYAISALADAGCTQICLVIGPEQGAFRQHFERVRKRRVHISFAIQAEPIGTAKAVLAARSFAANDNFLVVNSDNLYPVDGLRRLTEMRGCGTLGFELAALVEQSNFSAERVRSFGVLHVDARGEFVRLEEKPEQVAPDALISMNCWAFTPEIFRACEEAPLSARGEYELPQAVDYAVQRLGVSFEVARFRGGVLDLSTRADIATLAGRLDPASVRL